jgi:hypothetical protein
VGKRPRSKRPILSPAEFVKDAWESGIHDLPSFRSVVETFESEAIHLFNDQLRMRDIENTPLFTLGGGLSDREIRQF